VNMKCSVNLALVVTLLSACGGTSSPSQGAQAGAGGVGGSGMAGGVGGNGMAGAAGGVGGSGMTSGAGTSSGGRAASGASGNAGGPTTLSAGVHVVLHFGLNDECAGDQVLPVMNGQANCRVVLTGVNGSCTTPGLLGVTPSDESAVIAAARAAGATSVEQPVCQVTQLPASSSAACAGSSAAGWCYVNGACDATSTKTCADAICVTPTFAAAKVAYQLPAWIVCD
jgi:hypothetical protein